MGLFRGNNPQVVQKRDVLCCLQGGEEKRSLADSSKCSVSQTFEEKMSNGNTEKFWRVLIGVLSFCLFVLVIVAVLLHRNKAPSVLTPGNSTTTPTVVKNPDSIAIPGYELLELKAGTQKQTICLPNPPQNDCYFQIRLYLEDGTLLWESELIEPGKTSKPMVLTAALKKGTYPNALLHYSCYRMDGELTPLNGAQTKVTLWVK